MMIRTLRTGSTTTTTTQPDGFFRTGHFRTRNSTVFFSAEEDAVAEEDDEDDEDEEGVIVDEVVVEDDCPCSYTYEYEYECGCPDCGDSGGPVSVHTGGRVSCNNVHRNVLYQVSPAQMERMRTYRAVPLPSRSYELVKRLEAVAACHCTSVPVVLRSWRRERHAEEEADEEDEDTDVRLSSAELSALDRTLAKEL